MTVPLSVLDLVPVTEGATDGDALQASVEFARTADTLGYRRIWYAEHHNQPGYAAAATGVLVAHVAAHTHRIRVGAGGVMLPNHSPLVVAEQFGTLAWLHPDRVDLGVGRGIGGNPETLQALRRTEDTAARYPQDLRELRDYLWRSDSADVAAIPGRRTRVPLYVLGSSTGGARLAAELGLPYCFASHFAPDALEEAARVYRSEFRPSAQASKPYLIAGVNVTAADTDADAQEQVRLWRLRLATGLATGRAPRSPAEVDAVLDTPAGRHVLHRYTNWATGNPRAAAHDLRSFAERTRADELVLEHQAVTPKARLRSVELVAEAVGLSPG